MNVIVTGGAGFIGSHLVDLLLEKGNSVRCIDDLSNGKIENIQKHLENPNFIFFNKNICTDLQDSMFTDAEIVYHLAGVGDVIPSITNPEKYIDINLNGTFQVFNFSRIAGVKKFVYAASSSCYGNAQIPTNENAPISTLHPYALSKYLGEQLVFGLANIYSISVSSVCIFNAYGRRFKTSGAYGSVIGVFLKQALSKSPLTIAGDGNQTRDFVHVRDVAEAFYLVAKFGENLNRYNLGSGKSVSINELAARIGGAITKIPDRGGEARDTLADSSKIRRVTGWEPRINFNDGCMEMLDNINEWADAPLWTEELIRKQVKIWEQYFGGNLNE